MKTCRSCQTEKPLTEFYRNPRARDRLHSECKPCLLARARRWQLNNPERAKESSRYTPKRRDYFREYMRAYRARKKEAKL